MSFHSMNVVSESADCQIAECIIALTKVELVTFLRENLLTRIESKKIEMNEKMNIPLAWKPLHCDFHNLIGLIQF